MWGLVANPEDRFSYNEAHFIVGFKGSRLHRGVNMMMFHSHSTVTDKNTY